MSRQVSRMAGVELNRPVRHGDERGWFSELWRRGGSELDAACQLNMSFSGAGVLRGMHLQKRHPQGKLLWVLQGEILDVVVDLRPASATFGRWWQTVLSADGTQLRVPRGCAHGFLVLSESALVQYLVDQPYLPEDELTLRYDDPDIAIEWPVEHPVVSEKDRNGVFWRELDFSRGYPEGP